MKLTVDEVLGTPKINQEEGPNEQEKGSGNIRELQAQEMKREMHHWKRRKRKSGKAGKAGKVKTKTAINMAYFEAHRKGRRSPRRNKRGGPGRAKDREYSPFFGYQVVAREFFHVGNGHELRDDGGMDLNSLKAAGGRGPM